MLLTLFLIFLVLAYLVGSIPTAYLFVKKIKGVDIRSLGSGNVGATNAARVLGRPIGIFILALDALKGAAAAGALPWILRGLLGLEFLKIAVPAEGLWPLLLNGGLGLVYGLAAFLGHCYSPWLKFRGGKGVATGLGVYLVVAPAATLLTLVVCVLIIVLTRFVSVASITGAVLLPVGIVLFSWNRPTGIPWFVLGITCLLSAVVIYRHRANIRRLLRGEEHRA